MAASTKTTSFVDQSTSVIMMNIKSGQNLILDLDASRYNEVLKPMIECLRYSLLVQALTMAGTILLVHLSKAFSSATYNQREGVIHFEVASNKTSISKSHFCKILGLSTTVELVDPESISIIALIDMFYQMGYNGDVCLVEV